MLQLRALFAAAIVAIIAVAISACPSVAGCGPDNPNCIVPTAPAGTSTNQAASTAFVQQAISPFSPPGGTNGQIQYKNSGAFGGFTASGDATIATPSGVVTIQPNAVTSGKIAANAVTNAKINPGAVNTMKGTLDGAATSDIALTACTLTYQITKWVAGTGWQCGINPVLPSRAVAATLNLAAFDGITTQGYARPGDGGGATFYKHNTAILTSHIGNAGSCNNGTWPGIKLTGGSGSGAYGTLIVAGGVATNFSIQGAGAQGNRYAVNDVLTASNAGNVVCTTYPTVIVDSVGNAPFFDSSVTGFTINQAGSGCTNASYTGLTPQNTITNGGGYGDRLQINVDVAGGAVVGTSLHAPGGGYRVGDLVGFVNPNASVQIPGCGNQPNLQITSVSTARGSFTDFGGAAFQIINDDKINILAFGAVPDFNWLQTDGDATDNGPAIRAAMEFAAIGVGPADAHGFGGGTVYAPRGAYKVCGGVVQYEYVTFTGDGFGASMLKQCNSDGATTSLIYQGTLNAQVGVFAAKTWNMTLYGASTGTGPVIYSNSNQSGDAVRGVAIYPGATARTCLKYEIGYGGQSMYGIHDVLCVPNTGSPAFDFSGNFGVTITGETMVASVGTVAKGFRFGDGGVVYLGNGVHCEGSVTACVSVNGSGSSPPQVTVEGLLGPATNLIYIETGTPANLTTVINTRSNGSTCTVFMQATASCAKTGNQLGLATY